MPQLKLSIIIVNYNVRDLLLSCLSTLYEFHTNKNYEVIVVDNASKDGSIEMIRNKFPEVICIENKDNFGFPKANNQGFFIAKGEYIFMLNPDTEFNKNVFDELITYLDKHQEISMLGPKLLNTDGTLQRSVWRYPSLTSLFLETHYLSRFLKKKNYIDKDLNEIFVAESFSGAAILFRKEILSKLKGLDEKLFWIEDVDFCYRANQNNFTCIYYPKVSIVHHIGQSAKKDYTISILNQVVNKIKFSKKHYSKLNFLLTTLLSFYHVCLKIIFFTLLSPVNKIYFRKLKAYIYTLPRVFNPPQGVK